MKNVFTILVVFVVCFLATSMAFAGGEEPSTFEESSETVLPESAQVSTAESDLINMLLVEIQALRGEVAELKSQIQSEQPEEMLSIGVMPVEGVEKISGVGDSFRVMLVSALNDAGIRATESMDEELLNWVRRQDQLVRDGWIDPASAPRPGYLRGVSYYLLATVSLYEASESDPQWGPFTVEVQNVRMRHAFLRVDFRLINGASGMVIDAFQAEAMAEERTGPVLFDNSYDPRPIGEIVAEKVLSEMTEHIAELLNPAPASTE